MHQTFRLSLIATILAALCATFALADAPASQPAAADPGDDPTNYAPIAKYWGPQTADDQAEAVSQLKAYVETGLQAMHHRPLTLHETKYFLFYSDLTPSEAAKWAGLLDSMYARLASIFAIKSGENIWRGKALIVVFFKSEDYEQFEKTVEKHETHNSISVFHYFSNGKAHIVLYRETDQLKFAHLLVQQTVVGFLFRYRSPPRIPTWVSFGLGEVVASDLVKDRERPEVIPWAQAELRGRHDRLGEFFDTFNFPGWMIPVSEAMNEFMLKASKSNYVSFIDGIKDGLPVNDSLEKKYHCPKDRLITAFGQYLALPDLKE